MLVRATVLALSILPSISQAEWVSSEIKDEMRSSSVKVHTINSKPINGSGPSLTLRVIDKGDGDPGAMLDLARARVDDCPERGEKTCDLELKFGDGSVKKIMFATDDGQKFIPTEMGAFFGAVFHGEKLFVEMHVDGYPYQYHFTLDPLPVQYTPGPEIEVAGFKIGSKYEKDRPDLDRVKSDAGDECFSGKNVKNVIDGATFESVSMCFYKGAFYQAIITPGTKAAYQSGYKKMVKAFGKPDPDGIYPSWPDDKDLMISRNPRSAAYFTVGKGNYNHPFIISDESWTLLVPDPKK